jgi:hypothetical protein
VKKIVRAFRHGAMMRSSRAPAFDQGLGLRCVHCGGPVMVYIGSSKMLFDPAPAVTRWVESCERKCEGSRR